MWSLFRFTPTCWRLCSATVACFLTAGCGAGSAARSADPNVEVEALANDALSQLDGELELAGLTGRVEVIRDPWGVAHIYAESADDLFFAQGFVAAQDRLWQMDWWRRYGEGRLSEVLGPVALEHDRFARLLRYRGDMIAEYRSYHPDGQRIIRAFVAGVNAYIGRRRDNPPVEFQLTGIPLERWADDVPVLRMAGLAMTGNNLGEIGLLLRVRELGLEAANRENAPDPWDVLAIPAGLQVDIVPEDFRRRALGDRLPPPSLLPRFRGVAASASSGVAGLVLPLPGFLPRLIGATTPAGKQRVSRDRVPGAAVTERMPGDGSNNWVIDGSLSATGMPLLANDPHRSIATPSLRYLVHLVAPEWNVIGSGEPALPGVAIGHNERIGWGLTIVGIDQGDIFVEELHPEDDNRYMHNGDWAEFTGHTETIAVAGEEAREVTLKFGHHGPVILEDVENRRAYSFKTVLSEPGTAGYLGSLRVDQASSWEEYLEGMRGWKVPSENMIYADTDGNIGWMAAGLTPLRDRHDGWTGRLPVPGDGSYEWQGFRDTMELPHELNPSRNFIATANHNVMPEGYDPPLGYSWADPARYERLVEVLSTRPGDGFSVDAFKRLQYDEVSRVAARAGRLHLRGRPAGTRTRSAPRLEPRASPRQSGRRPLRRLA